MWTISATPDRPDAPIVNATWLGTGRRRRRGADEPLRDLLSDGARVVVAADGDGSAARLAQLLRDRGLDFKTVTGDTASHARTDLTTPGGYVVTAPLHRGCWVPGAKIAVVAEADLTGRRRTHRQPRPRKRQSLAFFEDLKPGNYVVHYQHGVGQYEGMVKRTIGGIERDYLLLAYKGGDKLYVPSDQIDALRQYVGGRDADAPPPRRRRLREGEGQGAQRRARDRAGARLLYQKRVNASGHAFAQDTPWQSQLEEAFPYAETPDQRKAIDDVKVDMERPYPMDRLLCGDVGFGKTEVAIRAAFKAIQDGKQVAVLAPTTLLATQHGNTFADRFAGFPIRVEVLSRFLTQKEAKKVVRGLESARSTASSARTACSRTT
jgi:transcription-repair coupling factor (superfamily II helicase)